MKMSTKKARGRGKLGKIAAAVLVSSLAGCGEPAPYRTCEPPEATTLSCGESDRAVLSEGDAAEIGGVVVTLGRATDTYADLGSPVEGELSDGSLRPVEYFHEWAIANVSINAGDCARYRGLIGEGEDWGISNLRITAATINAREGRAELQMIRGDCPRNCSQEGEADLTLGELDLADVGSARVQVTRIYSTRTRGAGEDFETILWARFLVSDGDNIAVTARAPLDFAGEPELTMETKTGTLPNGEISITVRSIDIESRTVSARIAYSSCE